jgi:DNA-binding MarR family transcriptional regulator
MDSESVIRVRRVVLRLARQLHAASDGGGLTPTQTSVLGLTASRGPLSVAELTELEALNPTMVSRVVSRLDSLGLVRRLRDPEDYRVARVEATPEGKRVYEQITAERSPARGLRGRPAWHAGRRTARSLAGAGEPRRGPPRCGPARAGSPSP